MIEHPYYPIIYVRGYAMTRGALEGAVATPYMGFNLGSTKIRQRWTGELDRFVFESPLVRLMKDHEYRDIYSNGAEIPEESSIPARSVIIYRYYDDASEAFGDGRRREIVDYAQGLSDLIDRVKRQVCGVDASAQRAFRVYLVAHSMGGLICRCFLQNAEIGNAAAKACVDKVFTFATPHNGIDVQLLGNVPGWLDFNNAANFNRKKIAEYLRLPTHEDGVDNLNDTFDYNRFFCLVGTDSRDYDVALGMSKSVVGPLSDGLVRIANATVRKAPRAFVHRSHSGDYGIVNSEEGYQNLVRFLFGDVRVDGRLEIEELSLPAHVEKKRQEGLPIRASYHFDVVLRARGKRWDLHRRITSENSSIFRSYEDLFERTNRRNPHLFSAFLSSRFVVSRTGRKSIGFSVDLGVHVPEYEIERKWWPDSHYDGGFLYRDKINLEAIEPTDANPQWRMRVGFDSKTPNRSTSTIEGEPGNQGIEFRVPIEQSTRPGIKAQLVLLARSWNR